MFTRCRYGAKTAWKSYFFPFCSHDASTKLYDTVTFTVTKQCRFPNGMRWKRNALRYRVNTENGTFWYRFSSQLSTLKLFYLFTLWHQIHGELDLLSSHLIKLTGIVWTMQNGLEIKRQFFVPASCEHSLREVKKFWRRESQKRCDDMSKFDHRVIRDNFV